MASVTKGCSSATQSGSYDYWDILTNLYASDGMLTSCTLDIGTTNYLSFFFGLTTAHVPSGSTIDGITFTLSGLHGDSNSDSDSEVKILIAGTATGTNKANNLGWRTNHSLTYGTNASPSSVWGVSVSDSDVRHSQFGLRILCVGDSSDTLDIDYASVTVYYTAGGGGGGGNPNGGMGANTAILLEVLKL